jgi:hypothetical protein
MKPPPPASAFSGRVGKNAERTVESVNLQPLELLLELLAHRSLSEGGLLETRRRAGRIGGEHRFDEDARHHAEREIINSDARNAIHEVNAFFFVRS